MTQLAREEALRAKWDGVDDDLYERLRGIGATDDGARRWARRLASA